MNRRYKLIFRSRFQAIYQYTACWLSLWEWHFSNISEALPMPILSPPVILLSSLLNFMPIVLRNSSHYFRQHIFHPHDASVLMPPRCGRLCASTNSRADRSRAAHGRARQRAVLRRARLRDRGHLGRPPQPGRLHRFLRHGPVRKARRASEMAGLDRTLWG